MFGLDKEFWSANLLPLLDVKSLRFQEGIALAERQDFEALTRHSRREEAAWKEQEGPC